MISIRAEIQDVIDGKVDKHENLLKNAPHTAQMLVRHHNRGLMVIIYIKSIFNAFVLPNDLSTLCVPPLIHLSDE